MSRQWVANASPLILLGKADQTSLLTKWDELMIPELVVREVRRRPDGERVVAELSSVPTVRFAEHSEVPQSVEHWDLGPGESQVLAVAADRPGARAVLDDREARRCAASIEIPVIGTVGIVARAKRRGLIAEARPILDRLRSVGLYLSTDLLDEALDYLGE